MTSFVKRDDTRSITLLMFDVNLLHLSLFKILRKLVLKVMKISLIVTFFENKVIIFIAAYCFLIAFRPIFWALRLYLPKTFSIFEQA